MFTFFKRINEAKGAGNSAPVGVVLIVGLDLDEALREATDRPGDFLPEYFGRIEEMVRGGFVAAAPDKLEIVPVQGGYRVGWNAPNGEVQMLAKVIVLGCCDVIEAFDEFNRKQMEHGFPVVRAALGVGTGRLAVRGDSFFGDALTEASKQSTFAQANGAVLAMGLDLASLLVGPGFASEIQRGAGPKEAVGVRFERKDLPSLRLALG